MSSTTIANMGPLPGRRISRCGSGNTGVMVRAVVKGAVGTAGLGTTAGAGGFNSSSGTALATTRGAGVADGAAVSGRVGRATTTGACGGATGGSAARTRLWSPRISGSTKRGLADRLGTWVRAARSAVGSSSGIPSARNTGSVRWLVTRGGGPRRACATTTAESSTSAAAAMLSGRMRRRSRRHARRKPRVRPAARRLRTARPAQNYPSPPDPGAIHGLRCAVEASRKAALLWEHFTVCSPGTMSVAFLPHPRRLTWITLLRFSARCAPRAPIRARRCFS